MDTLLKQLLGDPNSYRWSQTNHRLPTLNSAQRTLAMKILGYGSKDNPTFDLLLGIQASKECSTDTTGYALSGLHPTPGRMLSETGFMRANATLDGVTQRCVRHTPDKEGLKQNEYMIGSNLYPVIRFEANKLYIDVDAGEYPLTVNLFYIREPKELVVSGATGYQVTTCELDTGLHDLVVKYAEGLCRRIGNDFQQYQLIAQEVENELQAVVRSSGVSIKSGTIGQYMREGA